MKFIAQMTYCTHHATCGTHTNHKLHSLVQEPSTRTDCQTQRPPKQTHMRNAHKPQQKERRNHATHISRTTHIAPGTHATYSTHRSRHTRNIQHTSLQAHTQHTAHRGSRNAQCQTHNIYTNVSVIQNTRYLTQLAKCTDHRTE